MDGEDMGDLRKCSTENCKDKETPGCRGKCFKHYQQLRRLVTKSDGEITWPALVAAGHCEATREEIDPTRDYIAKVKADLAAMKKRKPRTQRSVRVVE
jgi:hypothetical protein